MNIINNKKPRYKKLHIKNAGIATYIVNVNIYTNKLIYKTYPGIVYIQTNIITEHHCFYCYYNV